MNLREIINNYIDKYLSDAEIYSAVGTFSNVRESKSLVDFTTLTGDIIFDVCLNSYSDVSTGMIIIPKSGTKGVITFLSNTDAIVSHVVSPGKIKLLVGNSELLIDNDEVTFNGGNNEGLINITDLVSKLNTVESDLNTIKNIFAFFVPVSGDGGAALKAATSTWAANTLTQTKKSDIEDTKVKH